MSTTIIRVNGIEVRVPANATPQQLDQIAKMENDRQKAEAVKDAPTAPSSQVVAPVQAPPKSTVAPSNTGFVVDNLKQGFSEGLGTLGGLAKGIGGGLKDLATGTTENRADAFARRFKSIADAGKTFGEEALGQQGYEGQNQFTKGIAAGIKAIGDPTTLASAGLGAVAKVGIAKAAPVAMESLGSFAAGMGAEQFRYGAEKLGGGVGSQVAASLLGGGLTQIASGAALRKSGEVAVKSLPIDRVKAKFWDINPSAMKTLGFKEPTPQPEALPKDLQGAAGQKLRQAAAGYEVSTGNRLSDDLAGAIQTQRDMGVKNPALVGVDSPELTQVVSEAAGTSAALRSSLQNNVDDARLAAQKTVEDIVGTAEDNAAALARVVPKALEVDPQIRAGMSKLREQTQARIKAFGDSRGDGDSTALGLRLEEAVTKEKTAAQQITSPLYQKAIVDAEARGERVPPEVLREGISALIKETGSLNIFEKNPFAESVIKSLEKATATGDSWASAELQAVRKAKTDAEVSGDSVAVEALAAQEATLIDRLGAGKGLSVAELDQFKRAINEESRNPDRSSAQKKALQMFKDTIFGAYGPDGQRAGGFVEAVSPQFSKEYRAADTAYREIMVPRFNTKTLGDITATSFGEQVVGKIASPREPSRVAEFLKAVGPENKGLAEAALLSKLSRKGPDGEITQKDFTNWMNAYRDHLEYLPELKAEATSLEKFSLASLRIQDKMALDLKALTTDHIRKDLNGEKDVLVRDVLSRSINGEPTPRFESTQALLDKVVKDPVFAKDLYRQYGDKPEFMKAITSSVILRVMQTDTPMTALARIKKENPVLAGSIVKYEKDLGKVYALVERLKNIKPIGNPLDSMPKDAMEAATGTSGRSVFKKATERIGSVSNRVARLFSESKDNRERQAQTKLIQKLAADPDQLPIILRQLEALESPRASDLQKNEAFVYLFEKVDIAKGLMSKDPEINAEAKRRLTGGVTGLAKDLLLGTAEVANKVAAKISQRLYVGQQSREPINSDEDRETARRKAMDEALNMGSYR